jgi:hypothetical protein
MYGSTSSSTTYINDLLAPKIFPVLSPECFSDANCIPYEVFTYQGVTQEAAAQLGGVGIQRNHTALTSFVAFVTGNLEFGLHRSQNGWH